MRDVDCGADLETLVTLLAIALFEYRPDSLIYHIDKGDVLRTYVCTCPAANTESPVHNVLYVA
jgi:hypothetical protein